LKYIIIILIITFSCHFEACTCFKESQENIGFAPEDGVKVVKLFQGFLSWYKDNYNKSAGFRLVGTNKNGYYFVDKKVCKKYLKHIKSSGFISDIYTERWQQYFSEMAQKFKENPQNEGPPEGFDYDLISGTQEPELFYSPSENLKLSITKLEKYKVVIRTIDIWEHQFTLSKSKGEWKIDDIEILGYPSESNQKQN
jgi:hypothetical protein